MAHNSDSCDAAGTSPQRHLPTALQPASHGRRVWVIRDLALVVRQARCGQQARVPSNLQVPRQLACGLGVSIVACTTSHGTCSTSSTSKRSTSVWRPCRVAQPPASRINCQPHPTAQHRPSQLTLKHGAVELLEQLGSQVFALLPEGGRRLRPVGGRALLLRGCCRRRMLLARRARRCCHPRPWLLLPWWCGTGAAARPSATQRGDGRKEGRQRTLCGCRLLLIQVIRPVQVTVAVAVHHPPANDMRGLCGGAQCRAGSQSPMQQGPCKRRRPTAAELARHLPAGSWAHRFCVVAGAAMRHSSSSSPSLSSLLSSSSITSGSAAGAAGAAAACAEGARLPAAAGGGGSGATRLPPCRRGEAAGRRLLASSLSSASLPTSRRLPGRGGTICSSSSSACSSSESTEEHVEPSGEPGSLPESGPLLAETNSASSVSLMVCNH